MILWTRTNVDGVVTLTINNPPVNALSMAAVAELIEALSQIAHDSPKAVIITGHGDRAFVAGANIKEINALPDVNAGAAFGEVMLRLGATIRTAAFPVIAAINGVAYGGGCELALMCDLRVASSTARMALPEVTLGLMPGWGGSVRVTRRAGTSTALLMALTGDPIDADNCLRLGLVDIVTQPAELHATATTLALRIGSMSASVVATIKRTIYAGADQPLEEALAAECATFAHIVVAPDAKEGTDAFLNKRAPQWKTS
jgi:enoyl-CoA hydratase/carnithine racemase